MTDSRATSLAMDPHELLDLGAFWVDLCHPLQEGQSPDWLVDLLSLEVEVPPGRDETVKKEVRNLLRRHGYRPTGRGKPASEYLVKAAQKGWLTSINLAVDVCNAVSLHSGLPVSVVDADRLQGKLRVGVGRPEDRYVFNPAGQEIKLGGLLCLFDEEGPSANPVKDSQRTKTAEGTKRLLVLIWGTKALPGRTDRAVKWYRELLERLGAQVTPAPLDR